MNIAPRTKQYVILKEKETTIKESYTVITTGPMDNDTDNKMEEQSGNKQLDKSMTEHTNPMNNNTANMIDPKIEEKE